MPNNKRAVKVGDTVVHRNEGRGKYLRGKRGIVLCIDGGCAESILVEFFDNINGHAGNLHNIRGKRGHCWWCYAADIAVDILPESEEG